MIQAALTAKRTEFLVSTENAAHACTKAQQENTALRVKASLEREAFTQESKLNLERAMVDLKRKNVDEQLLKQMAFDTVRNAYVGRSFSQVNVTNADKTDAASALMARLFSGKE